MTKHSVTREIGIDAGHRVFTHGSKCRQMHGHRYAIQATCVTRDELISEGEQRDMTVDFGFLKGAMMDQIDHYCDHGFIWSTEDGMLEKFLKKTTLDECKLKVIQDGFCFINLPDLGMKFYIVPFIPTAEKLAEHWFKKLQTPVDQLSLGAAELKEITVWETPNCKASYTDG